MMIDAPGYDADANDNEIVLTESNGNEIRNYVNNMM
jgi:hypothetical protein